MESEDRIKMLAEHLIWAINQAYNGSDLIQEALQQIEEEGYRVDILLAAFTRFDKTDSDEFPAEQLSLISQKKEEPVSENDEVGEEEEMVLDEALPLSSEINDFDRTFLKLIKVGYCGK